MKARAERFGIPFNPNATSTQRNKPASKAAAAVAEKKSSSSTATATDAAAAAPQAKQKAGAIDKAPIGVSEEVLAKRAAKFGLPEKKVEEKKANGASKDAGAGAAAKPASVAKETPRPAQDITP
jgi:SAP domain-containing ribonucleoprotein